MAIFKHILTGEIVDAPEHYLEHPILGAYLAPVDSEVDASKAETKTKKTKGFSFGTSTENNEEINNA
jgi:hypothetical protein